ncbi:MmcQ/YjbR family DNA-binding protein [Hephaestia sp. GCM10023244]|uniref:MmcQ/YjbR family DNA-binding protein n=1 Tax=unclassified Hephaestia TaxID=2631281 RepID=UPI0020778423|nr:MmcQ/YjbR family DNA-binding protein [Hephaestia sp. MAHUQ-44]MCM8731385.1 MmcQ/YjbR family DNA-binding protein [Hephaestia sp. MAHUQ-44]
MTAAPPLDRLRAAALALPETSERLSHGQPTFFVAGKQFAQFRDNHHGDGRVVVCVRVAGPDEQAMLLEIAPETYNKPAYLPSWLGINLASPDTDWDHIEERLAQSWALAAPARLRAAEGR